MASIFFVNSPAFAESIGNACEKRSVSDESIPLDPGECHTYSSQLAPGHYWIKVVETGIDVVLSANAEKQQKRVDIPVGRFSIENIWLDIKHEQLVTIKVETDDDVGISRGAYSLGLERVPAGETQLLLALQATETASGLYHEQQWQQAVDAYQTAAILWQQSDNHGLAAYCLHAAAYMLMYPLRNEEGSLGEALSLLRKTRQEWGLGGFPTRELAAQKDIGQVLFWLERYPEAEQAFARVLATKQKGTGPAYLVGVSLNDLGFIDIDLGRPRQSFEHYTRAISVFEENGDVIEANNTRHNLAILRKLLGETEMATNMLEEVRELWLQVDEPARAAMAQTVLVDLYYEQGQPRKAVTALDEAMAFFSKQARYEDWVAILELKYARIELALGRYENAGQAANRAMLWAVKMDKHRSQARSLIVLADVAQKIDDTDRAIELLHSAKSVFESNEHTPQSLWIDIELGAAYVDAGKASDATEIITLVLENVGGFRGLQAQALLVWSDIEVLTNPVAAEKSARQASKIYQEIVDPLGEYKSLRRIANAKLALKDWAAAIATMRTARDVLNSISGTFVLPQFRSRYLAQHQEFMDQLIQALEQQSVEEGNNKSYEIIFELENRRTRGLGAQQGSWSTDSNTESDNQVFEYNVALDDFSKSLQDSLLPAISDSVDDSEFAFKNLNTKLHKLEAAQRQLLGSESELSAGLSIDNLQEFIDSLLPEHRGILYFHVGATESRAFLITKDGLSSRTLPGRKELSGLVSETLLYFSNAGMIPNPSVEKLRTLLMDLVKGQQLSEVLVIPDGPLNNFPISSLAILNADKANQDTASIIWTYLPSLSNAEMLIRQYAEHGILGKGKVLLMGDPVTNPADPRLNQQFSGDGLTRLLSSADEVDTIADILSAEPKAILTGFAARKNRITAMDEPHDIVHIASHGILDSRFPASSGVLLSTFDSDGNKVAGHLGWNDLRGIQLPVGLVFLSGCSTALGENLPGDGLFGITRSFLDAGASAVIASYWRIGDRATTQFASEYYRQLVSGQSGPAALHRAMQYVRKIRHYEHPFYWAGFGYHGYWDLSWEKSGVTSTVTTEISQGD